MPYVAKEPASLDHSPGSIAPRLPTEERRRVAVQGSGKDSVKHGQAYRIRVTLAAMPTIDH